jgi:hypothetical protein
MILLMDHHVHLVNHHVKIALIIRLNVHHVFKIRFIQTILAVVSVVIMLIRAIFVNYAFILALIALIIKINAYHVLLHLF